MFAGKRHADDNALVRRYLADRGLDALGTGDEPLLRHLAQCPSCSSRYEAVQALLDDSREVPVADADAAFTVDRLAHQRDRILRRVEAHITGARVLSFPAAMQASASPWRSPAAMRWITAAAAAGLIVGLTAGRYWHVDAGTGGTQEVRRSAPASAGSPGRATPVIRAVNLRSVAADDDLLSAVDMALAGPGTDELRAIDAFTLRQPDVPRAKKN
ncbi:MAG: hypothetical protein AABY89_07600 [Acidobacteriota bacterium]